MRATLLVLLGGLILLLGCDRGSSSGAALPATIEEYLPLRLGDVELEAQVALTPGEQRVGLMYRESLEPDRGMLFVYDSPRQMTFWMKNTLIPLDIGFFDAEGTLLQVSRMFPRDLTRVSSASDAALYALEMNQGWFAEKGLRPGVRLDPALLRTALARRAAAAPSPTAQP